MTNIIYGFACSGNTMSHFFVACEIINNICHSFIINELYKCACLDACQLLLNFWPPSAVLLAPILSSPLNLGGFSSCDLMQKQIVAGLAGMPLHQPRFIRVLWCEELLCIDRLISIKIFHLCESIPWQAVLAMYIEFEARRHILDAVHWAVLSRVCGAYWDPCCNLQ